jgi:hypothetical protein
VPPAKTSSKKRDNYSWEELCGSTRQEIGKIQRQKNPGGLPLHSMPRHGPFVCHFGGPGIGISAWNIIKYNRVAPRPWTGGGE